MFLYELFSEKIIQMTFKNLVTVAPLAFFATTGAQAQQALDGCYEATNGYAASVSILPMDPFVPAEGDEQLGTYRIALFNPDAPIGERRLVLRGPYRGEIVATALDENPPTVTLKHVLVAYLAQAQGEFIVTDGDVGQIVGGTGTTVEVVETLHPVAGTGRFGGLDPDQSSITVTGTLDAATGTNVFNLDSGQLCFQAGP